MFNINHKNTSLNADRSASLKSFDSSEVAMLRIVVNEMIHVVKTGDKRGLVTILDHVANREVALKTIKAIVKAGASKAIKVGSDDDGLTVTLAKKVADRNFNVKQMKKLCDWRDEDTFGIFNTRLLASVGIGVSKDDKEFALDVACVSLVKRARKAGVDVDAILNGVRTAFDAEVEAETPTTDASDGKEAAEDFETTGLVAVG